MKKLAVGAALALLLGMVGCTNFNYPIGVQQYGTVTGTLIDASTKQPVGGSGANVFCGGQATHPGAASGQFTITQIAVTVTQCTVNAVGYQGAEFSISLTAGQTYNAGLVQLTPSLPGAGNG